MLSKSGFRIETGLLFPQLARQSSGMPLCSQPQLPLHSPGAEPCSPSRAEPVNAPGWQGAADPSLRALYNPGAHKTFIDWAERCEPGSPGGSGAAALLQTPAPINPLKTSSTTGRTRQLAASQNSAAGPPARREERLCLVIGLPMLVMTSAVSGPAPSGKQIWSSATWPPPQSQFIAPQVYGYIHVRVWCLSVADRGSVPSRAGLPAST